MYFLLFLFPLHLFGFNISYTESTSGYYKSDTSEVPGLKRLKIKSKILTSCAENRSMFKSCKSTNKRNLHLLQLQEPSFATKAWRIKLAIDCHKICKGKEDWTLIYTDYAKKIDLLEKKFKQLPKILQLDISTIKKKNIKEDRINPFVKRYIIPISKSDKFVDALEVYTFLPEEYIFNKRKYNGFLFNKHIREIQSNNTEEIIYKVVKESKNIQNIQEYRNDLIKSLEHKYLLLEYSDTYYKNQLMSTYGKNKLMNNNQINYAQIMFQGKYADFRIIINGKSKHKLQLIYQITPMMYYIDKFNDEFNKKLSKTLQLKEINQENKIFKESPIYKSFKDEI